MHLVDTCLLLGDDERSSRGLPGRRISLRFAVPYLPANTVSPWFCTLLVGTLIAPIPVPQCLGTLIVPPGSLGIPPTLVGAADRALGVFDTHPSISRNAMGTVHLQGLVVHVNAAGRVVCALTNNVRVEL